MNTQQQTFWGLDHITTPSSAVRSKTPISVKGQKKKAMTQREKLKSEKSKLSQSSTHFV